MAREKWVLGPSECLPKDKKVIESLLKEDISHHGFGIKKAAKVQGAIDAVGKYWLRDYLVSSSKPPEGLF